MIPDHAVARSLPSYYEAPNVLLGDPANHPLKVICIGSGVSGIMMAYKIQKDCENVDLVMYDKNADLGGTWFENRYPGCGCDIPAHAYSYNFALYPEWPQYCSYAKDIWGYLNKVSEVFELRKYMNFNSEIVKAQWQDKDGKWKISVKKRQRNGEVKFFEDSCNILLYATRVLNNYKWPDIKGRDMFRGKIIHSAAWPTDYQQEQWKSERVAVIGSGASSIQIVMNMQPFTKKLDVFVRSGIWFGAIADNFGIYHPYSKEDRERFSKDPAALVTYVKAIEEKLGTAMDLQISGSQAQKDALSFFYQRMKSHIKDDRLLRGFTPTYGVGCRRMTPADPYMIAIQEPNVEVHFRAVTQLTEKGIIDADGVHSEIDTVICATGFDTTFRPRFPIFGSDGIDLGVKWKISPEAYLGLAVPDMPNFFMFMGPSWPVHNGSVMGPLIANGDYVVNVINKMQSDQFKSIVPRADITGKFNQHVQHWVQRTVWTDDCRSWFKDNETGRITALWPGSALHYAQAIKHPRYEDYEIQYLNENPWAILGNGFSRAEKTPQMDPTPFLRVDAIDPKWLKAMQEGREQLLRVGNVVGYL